MSSQVSTEIKNDWVGPKAKIWGFIFRSKPLRYVLGFYVFSNKQARVIKRLLRERLSKQGHVVDLGAGSGFYTAVAARMNKQVRVSAVDLSEAMLAKLEAQIEKKRLRDRVTIYRENVEQTSLRSNSADVIIASNLLHEVKTPMPLMKEMYRLVKDDGVVVATEFVDNPFGRFFLRHHNDDVHGPYGAEELRQAFIESGFSRVRVDLDRNRLLAIVSK